MPLSVQEPSFKVQLYSLLLTCCGSCKPGTSGGMKVLQQVLLGKLSCFCPVASQLKSLGVPPDQLPSYTTIEMWLWAFTTTWVPASACLAADKLKNFLSSSLHTASRCIRSYIRSLWLMTTPSYSPLKQHILVSSHKKHLIQILLLLVHHCTHTTITCRNSLWRLYKIF